MHDIIDSIHDLPIADVLSRYITLQPTGSTMKACCPFHDEKTPSFVVFPSSNSYKCFGCGEGGDAIRFVQRKTGLDFVETLRAICKDHALPFKLESTDVDPAKLARRQSLVEINRKAADWFVQALHNNPEAIKYIGQRYDADTIAAWGIGYAPDGWNNLMNYLLSVNIPLDDIKAAGLLSVGKEKVFDRFRDRIIFPITDHRGDPVGFMGRYIKQKKDEPKYINTSDTEIFSKGKMFFGIHTALAEIRKTGKAYLVEGNPDVIRLQSIGILNTVATMGTSLTAEHARMLKKYCRAVTIIGDTDAAGIKAVDHSADILIKDASLFVNVVAIKSEEGVKEDPDSFFKDANQFRVYEGENAIDFIEYYARRKTADGNATADTKKTIIDYLASLIAMYEKPTRELYINKCATYIKPKKVWLDQLKELDKESDIREEKEIIPKHVDANLFERYGFYEDKNQYYFRSKNGVMRGCNFVMRPLFHIQSVINSKRLYEIINEFGIRFTIELAQKDLVSLQAFRLRVESMGNFLFEATETEMNKLKRYLYEKTESCIEVTQLGWQKAGFWAWGNGIYNGSWQKTTGYGIVKHKDENYYIPAFSSIYANEPTLFMFERKFIHLPGEIGWAELSTKLHKVFGVNAWFGLAFLFATINRDVIAQRFGFFPIMNLFGPKGAGKTAMAVIFLYFFGKANKGPNINNTSKPALADHVGQVSNAFAHVDEYKNSIEFEKVEFLKGVWDGTGRTRMNMEKDKKKETTSVDCGLILTGQEMPTADIALFSRLLFLIFTQTEFSDDERASFSELEAIMKKGVTHLTHEIISLRAHFIDNFFQVYAETEASIAKLTSEHTLEDRTLRNWTVVIAAMITMRQKIELDIDPDLFLKTGVEFMLRQNKETRRTNDVANFWNVFAYLVKEGELEENVDFIVRERLTEKTDRCGYNFDSMMQLLYLQHTRVFQKYLKHGSMTRGNVLPVKTLEYYLSNSKEYLGKKSAVAFKMKLSDADPTHHDLSISRNVTTAMVFNYDRLQNEYEISVTQTSYDVKQDMNDENLQKNFQSEKEQLHSTTTTTNQQIPENLPF